MAKNRNSCIYIPQVNNEPSQLYQDLYKKAGDNRPLANLIYASYLQQGVATSMDSKGYRRDRLGQHSAEDVAKMFDLTGIVNDSYRNLKTEAKLAGVMDSSDRYIDFTDAEQAYSKAQAFNATSKGRVANVYQHDDVFNVVLFEKDANTQIYTALVNEQMQLWETVKQGIASNGVDVAELTSVNPMIFNPAKAGQSISYLSRIQKTRPSNLTATDIATLLVLGKNTALVKNALSRGWGDVKATAQTMADVISGKNTSFGPSIATFIDNVIAECQKPSTFDSQQLASSYNAVAPTILSQGAEHDIAKTVDDLNQKYNIGKEVIVRGSREIDRLSEAAAEAILSLNKQLDALNRRTGRTTESERLAANIQSISNLLEQKKYYAGLVNFLATAVDYLNKAEARLKSIPTGGTMLDYCRERAHTITQLNNLRDSYYDTVAALSRIETLALEENMSKADIATLKEQATKIKNMFDAQESVVKGLVRDTMLDAYSEVLGDSTYMGQPIATLLEMAEEDSTIMDKLYSMTRVSNPMIAGLGRVIRMAQDAKVQQLSQIALRIRRATSALKSDGGGRDTSFIYEKDDNGNLTGRIVSPYNWDKYYQERNKARKEYYKGGARGMVLDAMMEQWELDNTEEVVVDQTSGRTERLPDTMLYGGKAFQFGWTPAQIKYYNDMMQIKAELGTLLPEYARRQYLAPQLRQSWRDIIKKAMKGRLSAKDTAKLLLDHMAVWKRRKDDTSINKTGIVQDAYNAAYSQTGFGDSPLKQVPIYFINKLDNQKDLLTDFSSAVQAFANTAINYRQMEDVRELVELMANFISDQGIKAKSSRGKSLYYKVEGATISVLQKLRLLSRGSRTEEIIDAFIDQYIYGNYRKKDDGIAGLVERIGNSLISYNSYKGLALNEKGAESNYLVGEAQMLIEAGAGQYYNIKEFTQAHARLWGDYTVKSIGQLSDYITNNKNSELNLLRDLFDPVQETNEELANKRYDRSFVRKFFEDNSLMFGYEIGEEILHLENMYSVLYHEKVIHNGEIVPLIQAFERVNKVDGNSELKIKDDYYRLDGSQIDDAYIQSVREAIRTVNQKTHGSMNREDKGIIHRNILGRAVMNFRQWMVEHYSRRFRSAHFESSAGNVLDTNYFLKTNVLVNGEKTKLINAFDRIDHVDGTFSLVLKDDVKTMNGETLDIDNIEEFKKNLDQQNKIMSGFYIDYIKYVADTFKYGFKYITKQDVNDIARWKDMTANQKANVKRARMELALIAFLSMLNWYAGNPEDHKGEALYRRYQYQLKRLLQDEVGSTPFGLFSTSNALLRRPIPSVTTIMGLSYPIIGIMSGDYDKTISSGRYKGWNKYKRDILKYTVPLWWQVEQSKHMDEDENIFNVFKSDYQMR